MNQAASNLSSFEDSRPHHVSARTRLFVYLSLWMLAAVALQTSLQPEGATETNFSPLQQHLYWLLYTPLMAFAGLAQAATWPHPFPGWTAWAVVAGFALHFIIAMANLRRSLFLVVTGVQALSLAVGVIYFVRQSWLPTGG